MATNRHAIIRYKALDKCFSNPYRRYFIEDLIEECNIKLNLFDGHEYNISRRTIMYDIDYMKSEEGWSAPIESYKDDKRVYYRYSDLDFSIDKRPLTDYELSLMKEAIAMLERFKGESEYGWMEELVTNLEDKLGLKGSGDKVIGYEQNPFLNGLERLSDLFNYIINKQPLTITYNHFTKGQIIWDIHPYYLKQYNNRWFLFGLNDRNKLITNIPLDRIADVEQKHIDFIYNDIDFDDYFDDIVGVSLPKDKAIENVLLKFAPERYPYIVSKPIHPTQTIIDNANCIIRIKVIPNKELESVILSFGNQVEVIEPQSFRQLISNNIAESYKLYSAVQECCTAGSDLCLEN